MDILIYLSIYGVRLGIYSVWFLCMCAVIMVDMEVEVVVTVVVVWTQYPDPVSETKQAGQ